MTENPSAAYGRNFARLRKRAGLNQEDVAALLGYKENRNANVSSIEVGRRPLPRPPMIRRHAELLKAEPWELMQGVETEYDQLRSGAPRDRNVTAAPGTFVESREDTRAQLLLERCEDEQARVAATRKQLEKKIGEISKQIAAQFGDLAAVVSRLPRGQTAVARRRRSGGARNHQRDSRRHDRKRPPETPTE